MAGVSGFTCVAALVVLAAEQDVGHRRVGLLLHHVGDRGPRLDRRPRWLRARACGWPAPGTSASTVVEPPVEQLVDLGGRCALRPAWPTRYAARVALANCAISAGGKRAVVEPQILQREVVDARARVALAELERHRRADRVLQRVGRDVDGLRHAVDVELARRRPCREPS